MVVVLIVVWLASHAGSWQLCCVFMLISFCVCQKWIHKNGTCPFTLRVFEDLLASMAGVATLEEFNIFAVNEKTNLFSSAC